MATPNEAIPLAVHDLEAFASSRLRVRNPAPKTQHAWQSITASLPAPAVSADYPVHPIALERQRAGLDKYKRLWIILDEYNQDITGASYYIDPAGPVGVFGKPFFSEVLKFALQRLGSAKAVNRSA